MGEGRKGNRKKWDEGLNLEDSQKSHDLHTPCCSLPTQEGQDSSRTRTRFVTNESGNSTNNRRCRNNEKPKQS